MQTLCKQTIEKNNTKIFGQLDPGKAPKGKPVRERAFIWEQNIWEIYNSTYLHQYRDKLQQWLDCTASTHSKTKYRDEYYSSTADTRFPRQVYGPDSLSNSATTFINGCTAQKLIKLSVVPSLCLYDQTVPSFSAVLISTVRIRSTFLCCTKLLSASTLLHSNKCFIPMKTLARDYSPFLSSREFSSLHKNEHDESLESSLLPSHMFHLRVRDSNLDPMDKIKHDPKALINLSLIN